MPIKDKTNRGITPKYKLKYSITKANTGEFVLYNRKFNLRVWHKDLAIATTELDIYFDWLYQKYGLAEDLKLSSKARLLKIKILKYIK